MDTQKVLRFSRVVRVTHWLIAVSGLALLILGSAHVIAVHVPVGIAFTFILLFHTIYHAARGEFDMLPRRSDLREAIQTIQAEWMHYDEPAHGKFMAQQRLFYAAIGLTALVLVFSGVTNVILHRAHIEPPDPRAVVAEGLHLVGAITFAVLLVVHIGTLLLKVNRPLLLSMFTGQVDTQYADKRHRNWQYPGKTG